MKTRATSPVDALSRVLFGTLLSLFFSLSTGCAQELRLGEFEPFVIAFEAEATRQGTPIVVTDLVIERGHLGPTEGGATVAAHCERAALATPRIVVNEDLWDTFDAPYQESILFHELGHCLLGRDHDDTLIDEGVARSLMKSDAPVGHVYVAHKAHYLHELFHPAE